MAARSLAPALAVAALSAALATAAAARAEGEPPPQGPAAPLFAPELSDMPEGFPGDIVVDLRDDASPGDIAAVEREYGVDLVAASDFSDAVDKLELARVEPSRVAALLERLRGDARVEVAEPLRVLWASFAPNDPLYESKQWHLRHVGAERAWSYGCGAGVTVAVVDTGVACFDSGPFAKGTDLAGTRCTPGYDFVRNQKEASDDQGHGTHVAGTIAQTTHNGMGAAGLAFCASLMPIKVLTRHGWGTSAAVAQGIRYAADHGAQIINLSLGGNQPSRIIERAVAHAQRRGALVVAAAGNSGRAVGWPAAYPGVVAVSATGSDDKIAWFSSRGPEVAIAAPGVEVTQQTVCDAGRNRCEIFGTFSGTSMASPHVAGAAALVMGLGVTDPEAVKGALFASARPRDDASLYGAGVLDAGAAVARTFGVRLVLRLLALVALAIAVAKRIRRRGGQMPRSASFVVAALAGATGIAPFLPLTGMPLGAGPVRTAFELAARPFAEWGLLLGAGVQRWLPLGNAAPALALAALLFGARRLRPVVGGFALGSAAYLTHLAFVADVAFPLGGTALRVWAGLHALVCVWLARVASDTKP